MLHLGSYQASHIWTPALSETSTTTSVQPKVPYLTGISPDIRKELVLSQAQLSVLTPVSLVTKRLSAKRVHLRGCENICGFSLNILPGHQHAVLAKSWEVLERHTLVCQLWKLFITHHSGSCHYSSSFILLAPMLNTAMPPHWILTATLIVRYCYYCGFTEESAKTLEHQKMFQDLTIWLNIWA